MACLAAVLFVLAVPSFGVRVDIEAAQMLAPDLAQNMTLQGDVTLDGLREQEQVQPPGAAGAIAGARAARKRREAGGGTASKKPTVTWHANQGTCTADACTAVMECIKAAAGGDPKNVDHAITTTTTLNGKNCMGMGREGGGWDTTTSLCVWHWNNWAGSKVMPKHWARKCTCGKMQFYGSNDFEQGAAMPGAYYLPCPSTCEAKTQEECDWPNAQKTCVKQDPWGLTTCA